MLKRVRVFLTAPDGQNLVVVRVDTNQPELYGLGCATLAYRAHVVKQIIDERFAPLLIVQDISLHDRHIDHVMVAHMNGCEEISADSSVDATGIAHRFYLAGLPCESGQNYLTMIADTAIEASIRRALDQKTPYFVRKTGLATP